MVNERILVCQGCLDKPFEHNRTIILPPDPVAITNPRPEPFVSDDNPISALNWDPLDLRGTATANGNIGNLTEGGGLDAAFSGAPEKRALLGAYRAASLVGASNYVGKAWSTAIITVPSQLSGQKPTYALTSFTATAPSDMPFLATGATTVALQGWDGAAWQAIWSDTSAGTAGEELTATGLTATAYYGHRLLITGDGASAVGIAYVEFNAAGEGVLAAAPAADPS